MLYSIYNNSRRIHISKEVATEYNRRALERNQITQLYDITRPNPKYNLFIANNEDPIHIEMFNDPEWCDFYSTCDIATFPIKYRDFIDFTVDDCSFQYPYIDYNKYLVTNTQQILTNTTLSDSEKIIDLNKVFACVAADQTVAEA